MGPRSAPPGVNTEKSSMKAAQAIGARQQNPALRRPNRHKLRGSVSAANIRSIMAGISVSAYGVLVQTSCERQRTSPDLDPHVVVIVEVSQGVKQSPTRYYLAYGVLTVVVDDGLSPPVRSIHWTHQLTGDEWAEIATRIRSVSALNDKYSAEEISASSAFGVSMVFVTISPERGLKSVTVENAFVVELADLVRAIDRCLPLDYRIAWESDLPGKANGE